jgi:hypothetical protein
MPKFNTSKTAFFTEEPRKASLNVEALKSVVDEDPQVAEEIRKLLLKKGSVEVFEIDRVFEDRPARTATPATPGTKAPGATAPAAPAPAQTEEEVTNFEIDTRLQTLIATIPIANPGTIIRSEYHNALRDAVRGLASRIGLSVNPTAEFRILTFAPNFLPMKSKSADAPNLNWTVTFEQAANPAVSANDIRRAVAGGFAVQLPDSATIYQMIVRGVRAASAPKPKSFKVNLHRKRLGKEEQSQTLISVDLKDIKDGAFEDKGSVQLSDNELSILDEDERVTGTTVSRRKAVSNEKWMYFVTAEFLAAEDTAAEKYEIDSIQILCIV